MIETTLLEKRTFWEIMVCNANSTANSIQFRQVHRLTNFEEMERQVNNIFKELTAMISWETPSTFKTSSMLPTTPNSEKTSLSTTMIERTTTRLKVTLLELPWMLGSWLRKNVKKWNSTRTASWSWRIKKVVTIQLITELSFQVS